MSDIRDDKLDQGLLALFRAEQAPLPAEPFMTALQARLRTELLAALLLEEQQARRQHLLITLIGTVAVIVLAGLLQPLIRSSADALGNLQTTVIQEIPALVDLSNPLPLVVAALYAAALAWCFRSRLQRFLAPW